MSRLRTVSLFSPQAGAILKEPLHFRVSSPKEEPKGVLSDEVSNEVRGERVEESRGVSECLSCHVTFDLRTDQVAHYKLDWHRYNLKRRLRGLSHMTQEVFESEAGDLSSISGSESDSDDSVQADSTHLSSSPFLYFTSGDNPNVYSVYRAAVIGGKESILSANLLLSLSHPPLWVILMQGGGHFAGAVFNGPNVLVHKTFHRYTVRAKRGTAQSVRDAQSGGHGPRSAGATLRRYNEAALEHEVQELLASWSTHLKEADAIFIRTPKTQQSIFTGGRNPPFSKNDHQIRGIPFVTRRPTLKEVKRVHSCLASIYIGGVAKSVDTETAVPKATVTKETASIAPPHSHNCVRLEERGDGGGDSGVGEGGEGRREGEGRKKKVKKKRKKGDRVDAEWQQQQPVAVDQSSSVEPTAPAVPLSPALSQLLAVCNDGGGEEEVVTLLQRLGLCQVVTEQDCTRQTQCTAEPGRSEVSGHSAGQETPLNVLYGGASPLHIVSEYGHAALVGILLHYGANPTLRNSAGCVPYLVAKDKPTRDCFRRFMGQHPLAYDYAAAQIPSPLTEEMEKERREKAAEKRREKKRITKKKKLKEKTQREEEEVEKKQRVAVSELSEREKRAMAAEKRLALQFSQDSSVQRAGTCSWCGCGLAGVVPFHRLQYQYCSMPCVRQHRTQLDGH